MNSMSKKEVYLPIIAGALFLLWVFSSLRLSIPNNLIADEFIYLNLRHLELPWHKFIFYNPGDFYGHGPLLPLLHSIFIKLGGQILTLRYFHLSLLPIIFLLTFLFKRKWTFNLMISLTLLFFHQTLWAQSTLLFPEVIQVTLGILTYFLWKKQKLKSFMTIATLNIFLRESSLAFIIPLMVLDFTKGKLKNRFANYTLPLGFLFIHLGFTFLGGATNPGWEQYHSQGFWVELHHMLTTINYFIPPIGGPLLLIIFVLSPLAQFDKIQKFVTIYRKMIELIFLCTLIIFLLTLFGLELSDPTPLTLSKLIYRSNGLGWFTFGFSLLLGIPLSLIKLPDQLFFALFSSLLNVAFFLWYQAHAPREIILPFVMLVWCLGTLSDSSWRSFRYTASIVTFIAFSLSPYLLGETKTKLFPLRILNFNELRTLDMRDKRFLQRTSQNNIRFKYEDQNLLYLEDSRLSPYQVKSSIEADKVLSMYPHFNGQAIDQGEALFLYPEKK